MTTPGGLPIRTEELLAHRAWVRALAHRLVRDPGRADDLEQETWATALQRPPARRGSIRAWLRTVLMSRLRDAHRAETRRASRERAASRSVGVSSAADLAAAADAQRRVIQAVMALDEPYREVILFRFYEGLTPAEVAKRQGIPASTVRTRVARALDQLRADLDAHHGGDGRSWKRALVPLLAMEPAARAAGLSAAVVALSAAAIVALALVLPRLLSNDEEPDRVHVAEGGAEGPATREKTASNEEGAAGDPSGDAGSGSASEKKAAESEPAAPDKGTADEAPGHGIGLGYDGTVTVLDTNGKPAVDVDVWLRVPPWPGKLARAGEIVYRARTNAEGKATIGLNTEDSWLRAEAYAGDLGAYSGSVMAGDLRAGVTLRLGPLVTVAGTVLDDRGEPVVARVELSATDGGRVEFLARGVSMFRGRFTFSRIPKAALGEEPMVMASASGYVATSVEVKSDPRGLTLRLGRALQVKGRCVNAAGHPLSGVEIQAVGFDGRRRTGRTGVFGFDNVPESGGKLRITARGYAAREIRIPAGSGTLALPDVVLKPGGTLRGRVVFPDGTPAEAYVYVNSHAVSQILHQGGTEKDGRFEFRNASEGTHDVHASAERGGQQLHARLEKIRAEGQELKLVLRPGKTLRIRFVHARTGAALSIASAKVALISKKNPKDRQDLVFGGASRGEVSFACDALGAFTLRVAIPGFEPRESDVAIHEDRETEFIARMHPRDG